MNKTTQKVRTRSDIALWTGILSVILSFAYYLVPLGIICSIIAIITGHSSRKSYRQDPQNIPVRIARKATIGWLCGIAGMCVSIFWGIWQLLSLGTG